MTTDRANPHERLSERATRERRFVGLDRGELNPERIDVEFCSL